MAQTSPAHDPLTQTWGLVPRYLRQQRAAEAAASRTQPAPAQVPDVAEVLRNARPVDAATADLRRRVVSAGTARRSPLAMAAPLYAGVAVMLGVLSVQ
jgi:hypothetical protein